MSSGGALLQLVAIGAQDALLVGNPTITFFNQVVNSHTNFAIDSIKHNFTGRVDYGNTVSVAISRNGDLISDMWVEAKISKNFGVIAKKDIGNFLIERASISIGGQEIDVQYGEWMHIWTELSTDLSKRGALNRLINLDFDEEENQFNYYKLNRDCVAATALIPLNFWFCRNPGLALPLIALQYHEVKLNITFATVDKLFHTINTDSSDAGGYSGSASAADVEKLEANVWVDYVYLDNEERVRFATTPHNYLITQLQTSGDQSIYGKCQRFDLEFNHPVKELVWVVKGQDMDKDGTVKSCDRSYVLESSDVQFIEESQTTQPAELNPVKSSELVLNGHERFQKRTGLYFDSLQTFKYHSGTSFTKGINVYSFSLKPEDSQPSGSCNFSRIDNATLELEFEEFTASNEFYKTACVEVFAVNYNQLKIISGMGGLTFSN